MTDTTAPSLVSVFPGDGATGVGIGPLVLTFDENISGTVVASIVTPGGATATVTAVIQANQLIFDDTAWWIGTQSAGAYSVTIAGGQIKDGAGNTIGSPITFGFTIGGAPDTTAPYLLTFRDANTSDTQSSITAGYWPRFEFSELVRRGSGLIELRSAAGTVIQTFDVAQIVPSSSTSYVSISGPSVTLQYLQDTAPGTTYTLYFPAGTFVDMAGNASAAITWSFTTAGMVDTTAPTITVTSPVDNATDVSVAPNIVLTFSEPVTISSAAVTIRRASDNAVIWTADAKNGTLSGDGLTLTLATNVPLDPSTAYYVLVDSGIAKDPSGNICTGISSPTVLNFTTAALPYVGQKGGAALIDSDCAIWQGSVITAVADGAYLNECALYVAAPGSAVADRTIFNYGIVRATSTLDTGTMAAVYFDDTGWPFDYPAKSYFVNYGTIEATNSMASDLPGITPVAIAIDGGGRPALYNRAGATITATGDRAFGVYANSGYAIDNAGTISALGSYSANGLYFLQNICYDTINNSGTISAVGDDGTRAAAIYFLIGTFTRLVNSGTISASATANSSSSTAIHYSSIYRQTIVNHGTISASIAIAGDQGSNIDEWTRIENDGTILGDILLGHDCDTIINSGTITGTVTIGTNTTGGTLYTDTDLFDGALGTFNGTIYAGTGDDVIRTGDGSSTIYGGPGNDTLDGGSNVDTAVFSGNKDAYAITQGATGTFTISGSDGTDTLTNIEYAKFDDTTIRLLRGSGTPINWAADPSTYMAGIRDFDGNDLGAATSWKLIGTADVNGDGTAEHILVNRQNGRWAEVGTEADGKTYFDNHNWAGDTRVVGIYIDPLVAQGIVQAGSDFDSQRRFQNDLNIENIHGILGQNDYNHDGLQEIYFSLTDGTAYLHACMHADGNIQYANYQNEQQVKDYLTSNGFTSTTWAGWFPAAQSPLAAVAG